MGGGAGYDDIDWGLQLFETICEEFHAVFDIRDTARFSKLFDCDGARWIDAALGNPIGDFGEIDGFQVD